MIITKITGVERTIKHLLKVSERIRNELWTIVVEIGREVENKLKQELECRVTSIQDPTNLTYTIIAEGVIICSVSGRVVLRKLEKESAYKGRGYFENLQESREYIESLVNYYFNLAKEKIKIMLNIVLK